MAAAGDGCADIGVGVLDYFLRRGAEELFQALRAATHPKFLCNHTQRVFRGDKMDPGDAGVGFEGAERLAGEDRAGSAGDGEG